MSTNGTNGVMQESLTKAVERKLERAIAHAYQETDEAAASTEMYAELVEAFHRKMQLLGPITDPESVAIRGLLNCARVLKEAHVKMGKALLDPTSVHVGMLRGLIAKPSWRHMVALHGEVPNGEDVQLMRIAELQEKLNAAEARVKSLQDLAGVCYAGLVAECDLSEEWADTLLDASLGEEFSTEDLIPYLPERQEVMWEVQVMYEPNGVPDPDQWSSWKQISREDYEKALAERRYFEYTNLRTRVTYGHAQVITAINQAPSATLALSPQYLNQHTHILAPFQVRVMDWMHSCFKPEVVVNQIERADRFLEEALELVQTFDGYDAARAHTLVDYTFSRPVGEREQEVGGVSVTLAALCGVTKISLNQASENELARVWTKIDVIREKQLTKADIFGPLP